MNFVRTTVLAGVTLLIAGCATVAYERVSSSFDDTEWVMIGFQDGRRDAELTEVPLYKYTMHLDASGQARFQFDCNKGTSSWTGAEQVPGQGSLTFPRIATTAMLCPGDSLGDSVAADMGKVARYSIYDGKLSLLPEGDGRIYVWDTVD